MHMNEELTICRAIMRLYTCCDFNLSNHRLSFSQPNEILQEYFSKEHAIKNAFDKVGIILYPSGVCSDFNGKIKTVPEVTFIYQPIQFEIPNNLLFSLQSVVEQLGIKPVPFHNQKLLFAYSGRYYDRETQAKLITDGLQVSERDWIILDMFTYLHASRDCFHHRLIHELLHVLGVEEKNMSSLIYYSCLGTYSISEMSEESVLAEIPKIYDSFCKALRRLIRDNTPSVNRIIALADSLRDYGFPEGISPALNATTFMPSKLFPEPEIEGYEVLFL